MKKDEMDREERRFEELIGAAGAEAPALDKAFLERLRGQSSREFLAAQSPRPSHERIGWMSTFKKALGVAAVLCVAAGVAGLMAYHFIWGSGGATVAWADVQAAVKNVHTAVFGISIGWDQDRPTAGKMMYMEPGLTRMETPEMVSIIDWEKGQFLALVPGAKTAHSTVITGTDNPYHSNWLGELKKVIGSQDADEVGEDTVNGRRVQGWRLTQNGEPVTVWADVKTAALVKVDFTVEGARFVMSDFEANVPLDTSLFSLKPPAEYVFHSETTMSASDPGIQDVVGLLGIWARGNGGVFPRTLDSSQFSQAVANVKWTKDDDPEAIGSMVSRAFTFLYTRGWTYRGSGVRLGSETKPIFWRRPQGSETYQVIYGDLTVKDVRKDDLDQSRSETEGRARPEGRAAPSVEKLPAGMVSDFEQDDISARFGLGWISSTDAIVGGKSTAKLELVKDGAAGSGQSLLITGKVAGGRSIGWAGAMFCPGVRPMAPADLSDARTLKFWTKGDGQRYAVMIYASHRGFIPEVTEFVAGSDWREHTFPISAFDGMDGMDGSDISGILFGRAPAAGTVRFQIDDVRFTSHTDVSPAREGAP